MKVCSINPTTGHTINNCGSATCQLCLRRKMRRRKRELVYKFLEFKNQGYELVATTIEPCGVPTEDRLELIKSVSNLASIKRAFVRKYMPQWYYFQTEFSNDRNFGDNNLLAPHCHGVIVMKPHQIVLDKTGTYVPIKNYTVQLKAVYDLKNWVGYTLKEIQHPTQLANSRIKLFSRSKNL